MNQPVEQFVTSTIKEDEGIDFAIYLDILLDYRWLIFSVAIVISLIGIGYALIAKPIYEANILIQVEDSPNSSKNLLGDLSSMFDVKTGATSEMVILRSRMVVSRAVDNLHLYKEVHPKYFPVIGQWLAEQNMQLSNPGLFGMGGFVWGNEKIDIATFITSESATPHEYTTLYSRAEMIIRPSTRA